MNLVIDAMSRAHDAWFNEFDPLLRSQIQAAHTLGLTALANDLYETRRWIETSLNEINGAIGADANAMARRAEESSHNMLKALLAGVTAGRRS